jgi:hypothetical protein
MDPESERHVGSAFSSRFLQRLGCGRVALAAATAISLAGCAGGDGRYESISSGGGGNTPPPLQPVFSSLQANIFTPRCALSGCHGGGGVLGLSLDADVSYGNLVNKPSAERPDLLRVRPSDPNDSYIVKKIMGAADIVGSRMPLNGPPFLTDAQIAAIRVWITNGAVDDRVAALSAAAPSTAASVRLARAAARAAEAWMPAGGSADVVADARLALASDTPAERRAAALADARSQAARGAALGDAKALAELADALELAGGAAEDARELRAIAMASLDSNVDAASALAAAARLALSGAMGDDDVSRRAGAVLAASPPTAEARARAAEALGWAALALGDDGLADEACRRIEALAEDEIDDGDAVAAALAALAVCRLARPDADAGQALASRLLEARSLVATPPDARLVAASLALRRPDSLALEPGSAGFRRRGRAGE